MFRFTQEPLSGGSPVLRWNYQYGLSVLVGIDAVNVMAAWYAAITDCVGNLMMVPAWTETCRSKCYMYIVLTFLWFYNSVHQLEQQRGSQL